MKVLFVFGSACLTLSSLMMFLIRLDTPVWVASGCNVVRNMAIGCLMMPLVTWGASGVKIEMTAHATALLTSLRTIAGAIGSAVFVAVMTIAANRSVGRYGEAASMHGVNIAFLAMGLSSVVLLLLALAVTREEKR